MNTEKISIIYVEIIVNFGLFLKFEFLLKYFREVLEIMRFLYL